MLITCIVPVYNNEQTLRHVLEALLACKGIDEIIVVDDGSRDGSAEIMRGTRGIKPIFNPRNLGKGGAVTRGIRYAQGDTLLLCDADLATLQPHHIQTLIYEYRYGDYDMVIAGRETDRGWWGYLMAILSGERIFRRSAIAPYLDLIASRGNGIEQIINYAHKGKKVKLILSKDIGHVLKFQKSGIRGWLPAYIKEAYQLTETEFMLMRLSFKKMLLKRNYIAL